MGIPSYILKFDTTVQARKQRVSEDQPCQPRQGKAPLQKSASLQAATSPLNKSHSATKLEKATPAGDVGTPVNRRPQKLEEPQRPPTPMNKSQSAAKLTTPSGDAGTPVNRRPQKSEDTHKPSMSTRGRGSSRSSPQLTRQHSVPENLHDVAVRLMSPRRCRSKSPDGVSYAPVLSGRAEKTETWNAFGQMLVTSFTHEACRIF